MIRLSANGTFTKTADFLTKASKAKVDILSILRSCAQDGVRALSQATPVETSRAQHSWDFEVTSEGGVHTITWTNSDVENGFPVVIMLQYGHGTGTGGYVQGRDFINPAIEPIFSKIADKAWKAVTSA